MPGVPSRPLLPADSDDIGKLFAEVRSAVSKCYGRRYASDYRDARRQLRDTLEAIYARALSSHGPDLALVLGRLAAAEMTRLPDV